RAVTCTVNPPSAAAPDEGAAGDGSAFAVARTGSGRSVGPFGAGVGAGVGGGAALATSLPSLAGSAFGAGVGAGATTSGRGSEATSRSGYDRPCPFVGSLDCGAAGGST